MGQDYEFEPLRPIQEVKGWDVFLDPPTIAEEGSIADRKWFDNMEKATKIFVYILTFILVLGCAVISKGTLLFMTSQISLDDTKEYCNQELGEDKNFMVTLPPVERALWIWVLMFAYFIPQLGTFLRSLRILCFKRWEMPSIGDATLITITESMSTIGYALLIYCILPELDVVKGAMLTNAVCVVPALLGMLSRKAGCNVSSLQAILDCLSLVGQLTAFVMWPRLGTLRIIWLIPVSLVLISCGWWENYISDDSRIPFIRNLSRKNKSFQNDRYFIYVFVSLWKCTLFLISVIVIFWLREDNVKFLFDNFTLAFQEHQINIAEILPLISTGPNAPDFDSAIQAGPGTEITTSSLTPLILLLINSLSTYLCYACAKFTCKIIIQSFSFALPINLAVPVTLSALVAICGRYSHNICAYQSTIPSYLFFDSPPLYQLSDFIVHEQSWVWLVWLLSQAWCTVHVWQATFEKLARTETLFVRPMFEAFLIDQDVALNRRRDVSGVVGVRKRREDEEDDDVSVLGEDTQNEDNTTLIYACGTMWHETKEEMMAFLKSIFRLDEEQCARKNSRTAFENYKTSDYFDLETHIFFDDAFIRRNELDNDPQLNIYVRTLLEAVDESATAVHGTEVRLNAPKIYLSPYGGRLEWTLPGDTKMYAHLKDKAKIRPKKRWSQVMYMYYLLGHRLTDNNFMSAESKQTKAENTYILALDGDIDFQPKAVDLLVDLMRKNKSLGAACGRIHPMGSGPMVWYQMFEYAIGHWLQKATEHMIGCVLCSPGCFSLFRGSALMDDSVMRKYTTQSSEAIHYVQYDQGEDRWLCTLLLQRGYKVEYSAASDAFTHCPEGFYEFYNQRRRWMPSTTANIMDLLGDYKRTIAANENISRLYILYQVVLMVGTILGPGTIFLMLVGAFVAAFQMEQWTSFLWNAVPIIVYMAICFLFNEKVQLFVAGFISAVYGLVMMAVLVGIMLQIQNDGLMAPSSLFFFCVAGEMIITALFHPKEIECLPYGIVYYITVPSMYMLLVIYSVFNMNNVSWGTREVTIVPEEKDDDIEAGAKPIIPEKPSGVKHKILNFFGNVNSDTSGSFELSFAGLFKCLLCTHSTTSEEQLQLQRLNINIDAITRKLESLQLQLLTGVVTSNSEEDAVDSQPRRRTTKHISGLKGESIIDDNASDSGSTSKESNFSSVCENSWLFDKGLGPTSYLKSHETEFWKDVIDKYLKPIDDSKTKATIAKNLKDLRDKSVFAFFMLNSVFVLVVFLLTLKKDDIHIKWPLGVKANFTYQDDTGDIVLMKEHLQLEPIGFVFLIFFAVLLVVQFIAMLLHRFGTLSQILANTVVNFTLLKKKKTNDEEIKSGNVVNIVKKIQRIRDDDNDTSRIQSIHRRRTVQKIIQQRPESSTFNLTEKFNERMNQYKNDENYKGPVHRNTIARLTRGNLGNLGNRNSDNDVILRHRNSTRRPGTSSGVTFSGINNEAFIIDDSGA